MLIEKMENCEEHKVKRPRGANFSAREKNILLNIINSFKNIIECKKSDAVTWKEKEQQWQEITMQFNAENGDLMPRSIDSLKKCYNNMKRNTRIDAAKDLQEMRRTGGGVPPAYEKDPNKDLIMGLLNEKTVVGLFNDFDSDLIVSEVDPVPNNLIVSEVDYEPDTQPSGSSAPANKVNLASNQDTRNIQVNIEYPYLFNEHVY